MVGGSLSATRRRDHRDRPLVAIVTGASSRYIVSLGRRRRAAVAVGGKGGGGRRWGGGGVGGGWGGGGGGGGGRRKEPRGSGTFGPRGSPGVDNNMRIGAWEIFWPGDRSMIPYDYYRQCP